MAYRSHLLIENRRLLTIPDGWTRHEVAFSRDGRAAAMVVSRNAAYAVMPSGGADTFDYATHPAVGPQGNITSCVVHRGHKRGVAVNGRVKTYCDWVDRPLISADGAVVAYAAMFHGAPHAGSMIDDCYCVIINDEVCGEYHQLGRLTMACDDVYVAYAARLGQEWMVVAGGRQYGMYEDVSSPILDSSGRRAAFWARSGDSWELRIEEHSVDRSEGGERPPVPTFSPNGTRIAYWRKRGERWYPCIDGNDTATAVAAYEDSVGRPVFSPDGARVAWAGITEEGVVVIADGRREHVYDAVGAPVFSAGGDHLAYKVRSDGKEAVVIDGKEGPKFELLAMDAQEDNTYLSDVPVFSDDGRRVAYQACHRGGAIVVVDGERSEPVLAITGGPAFGPDSHACVFGALLASGSQTLIVDGRQSERFDDMWSPEPGHALGVIWRPVFSGDGRHVAVGAQSGRQIWWRVFAV